MNKNKVRGLKWNLKKIKELVLHFIQLIITKIYNLINWYKINSILELGRICNSYETIWRFQ